MSSRANFVIVGPNGYELYYAAAGNSTDLLVFWGPEFTIRSIRTYDRLDESRWLDDLWAEGGVLVDPHGKVLIFFGGETVIEEILHRRIFLELLSYTWPGWEIRYAYEGIVDIAEYVGVPRGKVLDSDEGFDHGPTILASVSVAAMIGGFVSTVGSLIDYSGNLSIFPLSLQVLSLLRAGPDLVDRLLFAPAKGLLSVDDLPQGLPRSGFHIDLSSKTLELWTTKSEADIERRLGRLWPGWEVRWHRDNFEFQLERCGGQLHFSLESRQESMTSMKDALLWEDTRDPSPNLSMEDRRAILEPILKAVSAE